MDASLKPLIFALALTWTGCVGTDFIADPPAAPSLARLEIDQVVAALEVGQSATFSATYFDESGAERDDVAIVWTSSNPAIASIDPAGVVEGLQSGQISIVAAVDGVQSPPVMIGVVADPTQLAMVHAEADRGQLGIGETLQLIAQGSNAQGDQLDAPTYTWTSSDPSVVAIDADGLATALSAGRARLTASADGITSNSVLVQVVGDARRGTFAEKPGTRYRLSGQAALQNADGGGLELALSADFSVSAGPRLHLYLSSSNSVGPGSVDLGEIQAFTGAQTYAVPPDVELTSFDWVVIHCVPFNVTFGFAQFE